MEANEDDLFIKENIDDNSYYEINNEINNSNLKKSFLSTSTNNNNLTGNNIFLQQEGEDDSPIYVNYEDNDDVDQED